MCEELYIKADFERNSVDLNIAGQAGQESVPPLRDRLGALLNALPLDDQNIVSLEVDSATGRAVLTFNLGNPEEFDGTSLLLALGMTRIDTSYCDDMLNQFLERKYEAEESSEPTAEEQEADALSSEHEK